MLVGAIGAGARGSMELACDKAGKVVVGDLGEDQGREHFGVVWGVGVLEPAIHVRSNSYFPGLTYLLPLLGHMVTKWLA